MALVFPKLMTLDEFIVWWDESDLPYKHIELVNGEVVITANSFEQHEAMAAWLITEISIWIRAHRSAGLPKAKVYANFGWRVNVRNMRIPDVL